jgi:uncharacterized membrane protein YesL
MFLHCNFLQANGQGSIFFCTAMVARPRLLGYLSTQQWQALAACLCHFPENSGVSIYYCTVTLCHKVLIAAFTFIVIVEYTININNAVKINLIIT